MTATAPTAPARVSECAGAHPPRSFAVVAAQITLAGFLGCWFTTWLLAEGNHFSHVVAAATTVALVALIAALAWAFVAPCEPQATGRWNRRTGRGVVLLLVGGLGGIRYVHLPERITANNDQGSYALEAVWLARHGSPTLEAQALVESAPDFRRMLVDERPMQAQRDVAGESRHPYYLGFFVEDEARGVLHAQFPSAYPVLLASAYVIGGWTALQCVNVALILGATLAAGVLAQRWWGTRAAIVALAATGLFPLHVWLADSWFAEAAVMLTWLLALLALDEANDQTGWTRLLAIAASGVALALGIGAKLDGLAGLAALPFLIAAGWRWQSVRGRAAGLIVCAVPVVASAVLLWQQRGGYGGETLRSLASHLNANAVVLLVASAAIVSGGICYAVVRRRWPGARDEQKEHDRAAVMVARWTVALAWLGVLTYLYFVRSASTGSDRYYYWPYRTIIASYREATTVRLGWYFTAIGLWAAFAGVGWLVLTAKRAAQVAALLAGAATLLLFCYDLHNNPIQPYAMRRFLGYATPLLIVSLGGVFASVGRRRAAGVVGAVAALALLTAFLRIDERLNRVGDATGFDAQLRELADRIPRDAVVVAIAGNPVEELMAPLEFVYDRTVVLLKSPPRDDAQRAALHRQLLVWQNEGRPLWALTPTTYLPLGGVALEGGSRPVSGAILAGRLAPVVDREPGARLQQQWRYQLRPICVAPTFK